MFDIGFLELLLITVIGLVVLGPERLPVAIRTIRGWISGVRKFSDSVKTELTEELRIQELHANLKKAEQADMKNLSPEIAESLKTLKEAAEMVNRPYQLDKEPENLVSDTLSEIDKEAKVITDTSPSSENRIKN
jgi:sec-independent protein translocase protein TatB